MTNEEDLYKSIYGKIDCLDKNQKTLRDEFAMAAFGEALRWCRREKFDLGAFRRYAPALAYEWADAMLEARKVKAD